MRIARMTNRNDEFYFLVGPFLSKREIVEETGYPVWDDPNTIWFVAIGTEYYVKGSGDSAEIFGLEGEYTLGIGCVRYKKGGRAVPGSLYVLPQFRGKGVGLRLVQEQKKECLFHSNIEVVATPASLSIYKKAGFIETGTRGKYTLLTLET